MAQDSEVTDHWRAAQDAADLLVPVWTGAADALEGLPDRLRPSSPTQAYAIQQATAASLGRIGGWKVGASGPGPDATFTCAPMPLANMHAGTARLSSARFTSRIVEAEIALRLSRDLEARDEPYTAAELLDAVATCHPAIEVLQSRFTDPDHQDALTNLADLGIHGAFVYGAEFPAWRGCDWVREEVALTVDGRTARHTGNPGGEMIRLLGWLADVGARWAGGLQAGQVITTGSWTGKTAAGATGAVRAEFAHAGAVELEFFRP